MKFTGNAAFKGPWRNRKTGDIYTVLFLANANSTRADFVPTVVYRGRNRMIWARPLSEWPERFEFATTIHFANVGKTPMELLYNVPACNVPSWAHYGSSDPAKITCNACLALFRHPTL